MIFISEIGVFRDMIGVFRVMIGVFRDSVRIYCRELPLSMESSMEYLYFAE